VREQENIFPAPLLPELGEAARAPPVPRSHSVSRGEGLARQDRGWGMRANGLESTQLIWNLEFGIWNLEFLMVALDLRFTTNS
jgi:hypothetical protein